MEAVKGIESRAKQEVSDVFEAKQRAEKHQNADAWL